MSHIVCSAARHWWQHHAKVTVWETPMSRTKSRCVLFIQHIDAGSLSGLWSSDRILKNKNVYVNRFAFLADRRLRSNCRA